MIDYRYTNWSKDKTAEERQLLVAFLEMYAEHDYASQTRMNEMLGKVMKSPRKYKRSSKSYPSWLPIKELRNVSGHIIDHTSTYSYRDENTNELKYIFISEPYPQDGETYAEVQEICERHGVRFTVSADSEYYLGATVKLTFEKK